MVGDFLHCNKCGGNANDGDLVGDTLYCTKCSGADAVSRFSVFTAQERTILHVLLQDHANSVAEIANDHGLDVSSYLALIEQLEREAQ